MIEPRGTVFRLYNPASGELPRMQYRALVGSDGMLPTSPGWEWSDHHWEAHVFEKYAEADAHAKALCETGEHHVHACVHGADAEARRVARKLRGESAVAQALASVEPASVAAKEPATIPERMAKAKKSSRTRRGRKFRISSRECFERLEKQHLA